MFAFNSSTSLLCLEYTLDLKIQTRAEIRVSYLETCSQYVLMYHFFKNKALNEKNVILLFSIYFCMYNHQPTCCIMIFGTLYVEGLKSENTASVRIEKFFEKFSSGKCSA